MVVRLISKMLLLLSARVDVVVAVGGVITVATAPEENDDEDAIALHPVQILFWEKPSSWPGASILVGGRMKRRARWEKLM